MTEIERRTGKPISRLFDLIAGTSTGGILAVGLTARESSSDESGSCSPKFAAADLLNLYEEKGSQIFERSLWDGVTSVWGLADEKYPVHGLERILEAEFGEQQLKDALTDVLVTSYEIHDRRPYFFKSSKASKQPERNHFLRDVARATSAAPTYFEPAKVLPVDKDQDQAQARYLVDGGVFANNPALCAYAEAMSKGSSPNDLLVVSLGTGVATRRIEYEKAKDWGIGSWVRPVLSVMMDGVADAVDYQLNQMLATEEPGARYYRFNIGLKHALDDMDAAHRANIRGLKREAKRILHHQEMGPRFEALCSVIAE